ncbi:MAG TPA: SRPBCC family protein [Baekduia sp.]|nr:SRPBCC family protein [Baekduia sp.]
MPVTRRSALVDADPSTVWATVADPHQLPRWWPRVERVEAVSGRGFTEVLRSAKGAQVRADFRIGERHKPRGISWEQELEGTPFERLVQRAAVRVALAPAEAGTRVELELDRSLRGINRLGGFLFRRAHRRELDAALRALADLHEEG